MLPVCNILRIINLGKMIAIINTTRSTIFIIATIIKTIAASYREKNIIFVAKKVVTLISIQTMSNRRQKNFRDKTKNFMEIKANIIHFWLIMKGIQMIILMMLIKKQIIQKTMTKIVRNMLWLPIFLTNLSYIS